jgi:predicted dehydrogenase
MARSTSKKRQRRSSPTRSVRYAVIGLGHIAQAAVLPAFGHSRRNSALGALVSGSPKKLQMFGKRYGVERRCTYEDADELFASGDIDAVYIALPNDQHREWTLRAARAGLHVLCEKPMAVTARDCEQMIRATDAANVKLMIAYRLHFEQANLQAAQLARAGKLGALRFFSSDFSMQVRPNNIRLKRAKGGGPLYDIGVYCINAARYMMSEEPTRVWASATKSADSRFREVEETVTAVMQFKDERIASFTCSFGGADRSTYTVVGTKGSVTLDPAYEYAVGLSSRINIGDRQQKKETGKHDQFAAELLYFSDCILQDREPEPSGAEGLADIRIIQGMQRSIKTGRWVSVTMPKNNRRPTLRQADSRPAVLRSRGSRG